MKKRYLDINVVEAAKERFRRIFHDYDKVVFNFSGGKDSTAMVYVGLEVAKELGKTPIEVIYVDHEIEGLGTLKLIDEVAEMDGVNLIRYAIPFALRNACSLHAPKWYPWHPDEEALWVRPKPEGAITEVEKLPFAYDSTYEHPDGLPFKALGVKESPSFQRIATYHVEQYLNQGYSAISMIGLRAEESLARYCVMTRKAKECYLSTSSQGAYPIYDWTAYDVWKYIRDTGLPYNEEYDLMNKGVKHNKLKQQRVGSIFGEESLRALDEWPLYYRDFWHRILERAEGVKTAWRYNNDGIYTGTKVEKEPNVPWKDYLQVILSKASKAHRAMAKRQIEYVISWHTKQTAHPIADCEKDSCPLTGISWEFICKMAIRGDSKTRNQQAIPSLAKAARKRAKITRDEAVQRYGRPEYIKNYFHAKASGRTSHALGKTKVGASRRVATK